MRTDDNMQVRKFDKKFMYPVREDCHVQYMVQKTVVFCS